MAGELNSNAGYIAFGRETTPGVAVTPTRFVPLYSEDMRSNLNLVEDNAVFGRKFARLMVVPGQRSHGGSFTMMAEPNSAHIPYDMLYTRGTVTGSGPYTWPFTPEFDGPSTYTVDISNGSDVRRFVGVEASEVKPLWEGNEMRFQVTTAALRSFLGAEVDSVSTSTVTLKTLHDDPKPSAGLVVGDTVVLWKASDGSRQSFTVSSLTDTTVTLNSSPSAITAGDMLVIQPATPDLDILTPFQWARTEFHFADDAATALAAVHTPVETGSEWTHLHNFEDAEGAKSSGSYDPSALVRTDPDSNLTVRKFFRDQSEVRAFKRIDQRAIVVRCFSGTAYELRYTWSAVHPRSGGDKPMIAVNELLYDEIEHVPVYDQATGTDFKVEVINSISG